jgi:O-antigen/teichoic acid export membrane protein
MIRKALLYSFASKYFTVAIQIASTIILARILTPEHVGLFTIASALTGIAQMFRDFGISEYIIKEKSLSRETLSAAFTASIIIAWPIAILFILLTPLVSLFYEHEDAGYLIAILSINMFLSPFGSIPMAVMRKNMNFKAISIANVSNTIVNALASLGFAFLSFGAYSLAFASVLGTLTTVIVITLFKDDSTTFGIQFKGIKKVLRFGKNVGGSNIISYIANNMLELVIGKNNDIATLGLYSRGKSTITLFQSMVIDAVQPLISPYYAAAKTPDDKANAYLLSTKIVVYLSLPFCLVISLFSEPIINVLYGEQWLEASHYLPYLAIAFAIFTMSMFYEQILTTENLTRLYFLFKLSIATLKISIAISSFWISLETILLGLILLGVIRFIWVIVSIQSILTVSIRNYFNNLFHPIAASIIFTIVSLPIYLYTPEKSNLEKLLLLVFPALIWACYIFFCDKKVIYLLMNKQIK